MSTGHYPESQIASHPCSLSQIWRHHRLLIPLCVVWLAALAVLVLAARHRVPRPDEGHFSSAAYNLAHRGFAGTTTIDPAATGLLRIRERTYWTMPLYMLAEAAWFLVFPAGILWARLLTVALLLPAAFQLYRIVEELTADKRIATLAVMLLPADYAFLYAGVSARPDVLCLLLGLTAIASYLRMRTSNLGRALLVANFWLALCALTHPNALLHFVALSTLVIVYDRPRVKLPMLAGSALVYVAVMTPFFVWVFQDFEAFRAQTLANAVNNDRLSQTLNPLRLIAAELSRYANAYGLSSSQVLPKLKAFVLLIYGVALMAAVFNRRLRARRGVTGLLLLWCAYFAVQNVFNQKLSVYLVHILPIYAALVAALLVYCWTNARTVAAAAFSCAVVASIVIQIGGMFWTTRTHADSEQREVAAFVRRNASKAATINGTVTMLFALDFDSRLVEDHTLGLTTDRHPDVIITDDNYQASFGEMARRRPQLLAQVEDRLSTYTLVFRKAEYRVFFSPVLCRTQRDTCPLEPGSLGESRRFSRTTTH